MSLVHPTLGIPMTEAQYADEWRKNSQYFTENGLYDWMLEQLGTAKVLLEVGCGSGASTRKIASSGSEVLCIEVNKDAVNVAVNDLRAMGLNVSVLSLCDLQSWAPGTGINVSVLCADIFDDAVASAIPHGVFDAVLCWMTASYPAHISGILNKDFLSFDGSEGAAFRVKMQQRCYALGARALKNGGVVHIVDRGAMGSWNDKDYFRSMLVEAHREYAGSGYTIEKKDTLFKRLDKPFNTSHIQYVAPSEAVNAQVLTLSSCKAHKR